jgi:hypothetical protein
MPVLRYFLFVGGALLALLLICDAVFPQIPLPATLKSGSDLPAVRIQSARQWPERVVIDTSVPMTAPVKIAGSDLTQQGTGAVDTQKGTEREAFAQMNVAMSKPQTVSPAKLADRSGARSSQSPSLKVASAPKPSKRRIAKVHPSHPMMLVAQQPQPHFGFFGSTW